MTWVVMSSRQIYGWGKWGRAGRRHLLAWNVSSLSQPAKKGGSGWIHWDSISQPIFAPWSLFTNLIPNHLPAKKFNTTHILYISLCIETDMCIYLCFIHRKNMIFHTHLPTNNFPHSTENIYCKVSTFQLDYKLPVGKDCVLYKTIPRRYYYLCL